MAAVGAQATDEMYAVLEQDTVMRLYYDDQIEARGGVAEWWDSEITEQLRDATKKVVFDTSFKKAKPESTANWFLEFLNLETIEHLDYLNTENAKDMFGMFCGCRKLQSLDLSNFDTGNVENMSNMFSLCSSLQSLDVSDFDTRKVTNMYGMFSTLALKNLDLSSFRTPKVTNMAAMFAGSSRLKELDLRNFDMSHVESTTLMFYFCAELEKIIYEGDWNKNTAITHSENMFYACMKLKGEDGTQWDENHINIAYARTDGLDGKPGYFSAPSDFYGVYELGRKMTIFYDGKCAKRDGVKNWKTKDNALITDVIFDESVQNALPDDMSGWFAKFYSLKQIDHIDYLNTSELVGMTETFMNCISLTSLDLSSLNIEKVEYFNRTFLDCTALTELNLREWNLNPYAETTVGMFAGCAELTTIYCNHTWEAKWNGMTTDNMFSGCVKLVGGNNTAYDANYVKLEYARPGKDGQPGYFTEQTATGMESVQPSAVSSQKILRDGQLLILCGDKTYTIMGQEIR